MATSNKKVVIKQSAEKPVEVEVLAQAIVDIAAAGNRLSRSALNRKAVIILLSHASGKPQHVVKDVLDSIDQLERDYLRK